MSTNRIFIAGHKEMVGLAILNRLNKLKKKTLFEEK